MLGAFPASSPMGSIVRRVAVALSIALAAVLLWFRRVDPPTVPVLVATREIPAGSVNAVPCTNRRDSTLVYDAVFLSCMRPPAVFRADSGATMPRPDR